MTTVSEALRAELGEDILVAPVSVGRLGWRRVYYATMLAADAAAGLFAASVAVTLVAPSTLTGRATLAAAMSLGWLLICASGRAQDMRSMPSVGDDLRALVRVTGLAVAVASVAVLASGAYQLRDALLFGLPVAFVVSGSARAAGQSMLRVARTRGRCLNSVVVVGGEEEVLDLIGRMRRDSRLGLEPVAACLPGGGNRLSLVRYQVPVVGDVWQAAAAARRFRAAGVIVGSGPGIDATVVRRIGWQLEDDAAELLVAPAVSEVANGRLSVRSLAAAPLLHVAGRDRSRAGRVAKEILERSFAFLALLVLAPGLLTIAAAIKLTSPGPALFRQRRVGINGEEFTLFKFRTMVDNAHELRSALNHLNVFEAGPLFKIHRDPRVTRVGSLLRRASLDELPQLLNVLSGRMALVGPRPPLPSEVSRYTEDVRRRLLVKPGLTGLWQVSGRSDLSWEESVRLDLRYVENWSLGLDLQILFRTCSAVVRGRGAY